MTLVAACDFHDYCRNSQHVTIGGNSYLDFYALNETYSGRDGSWGVTYGAVGPRRVFYPLFTLTIVEPDAATMTLDRFGEKIKLIKTP